MLDMPRPQPISAPRRDRLTGDAGFGESDGAVDHRVVDDIAEHLDDSRHHLTSVQSPGVEHRDDDTGQLELGIETIVHLFDGVVEECQAAQAEVLAFHRNDDRIGAGQCIHREQAKRRLAVDEHVVVPIENRVQHASQGLLTSDLGDQLDLGGRKVDVAGQQVEAVDPSSHQHIVDGHTRFDQKVMDGQFQVVMLDAQSSRQRALGIEIH